jgi:hypothetical protein
MRPPERVGEDPLAEVLDPEVVAVDPVGKGMRVPRVGEELVGDIPLPDLAAEVGDLVGDVLVQQGAQLGVRDRAVGDALGQPVG